MKKYLFLVTIYYEEIDSHGGGLAVYIGETLTCNCLDASDALPINDNIEAIWFEICEPKSSKILIGAIYRPPGLESYPMGYFRFESNPRGGMEFFQRYAFTVADEDAPVILTRRVRERTVPWLTSEIKNTYKRLRNAVILKLRKEKSIYYSTRLSGNENPKDMWRTLK